MMLSEKSLKAHAKLEDYHQKVLDGVNRAKFKNLKNALASIRKDAIGSMRVAAKKKDYAPAGKPPNIHLGNLKRSIRFALDPSGEAGVVGPSADIVGIRGYVLEFAGTTLQTERDKSGRFVKGATQVRGVAERSKTRRKPHPFMGPAMERAVVRMQSDWRAAIT